MLGIKKTVVLSATIILVTGLTGCAGLATSQYSYSPTLKVNEVNKKSDCYDASVLLGKNLAMSKEIAKKVLVGVDSTISAEAGNTINAERNRHVGLFVGSGGEELAISLKDVSAETTFITVTTKTGFVGGAGQKAWSCEIVDQMVKMATK